MNRKFRNGPPGQVHQIGPYIISGSHSDLAGGMATLYYGYDPSHPREVVIKTIPATRMGLVDEDRHRRFDREIQLLERFNGHPHIVHLYDTGRDPAHNLRYLVLERLTGSNLRQWVEKHGVPSLDDALRILGEAASGLAAVHAEGVVHLDVKPSNYFAWTPVPDSPPRTKLLDFGVALKPFEDSTATYFFGGEGNAFSGTYAAPEQLVRKKVPTRSTDTLSPATDVFGLAATAWYLFTGLSPFSDECLDEIRKRDATFAVGRCDRMSPVFDMPSLQTLRSDVPEGVGALIARSFSADPAQRPQNAGEFLQELQRVMVQSQDSTATSTTTYGGPESRAGRISPAPVHPAVDPPTSTATTSIPVSALEELPLTVDPSTSTVTTSIPVSALKELPLTNVGPTPLGEENEPLTAGTKHTDPSGSASLHTLAPPSGTPDAPPGRSSAPGPVGELDVIPFGPPKPSREVPARPSPREPAPRPASERPSLGPAPLSRPSREPRPQSPPPPTRWKQVLGVAVAIAIILLASSVFVDWRNVADGLDPVPTAATGQHEPGTNSDLPGARQDSGQPTRESSSADQVAIVDPGTTPVTPDVGDVGAAGASTPQAGLSDSEGAAASNDPTAASGGGAKAGDGNVAPRTRGATRSAEATAPGFEIPSRTKQERAQQRSSGTRVAVGSRQSDGVIPPSSRRAGTPGVEGGARSVSSTEPEPQAPSGPPRLLGTPVLGGPSTSLLNLQKNIRRDLALAELRAGRGEFLAARVPLKKHLDVLQRTTWSGSDRVEVAALEELLRRKLEAIRRTCAAAAIAAVHNGDAGASEIRCM